MGPQIRYRDAVRILGGADEFQFLIWSIGSWVL